MRVFSLAANAACPILNALLAFRVGYRGLNSGTKRLIARS
jgi:hypothetical protein